MFAWCSITGAECRTASESLTFGTAYVGLMELASEGAQSGNLKDTVEMTDG